MTDNAEVSVGINSVTHDRQGTSHMGRKRTLASPFSRLITEVRTITKQ